MSEQKHKLFGEIRATADPDSRVREFVISTETLDRHGTVLRSTGWDLSKFSGTAFYQHESHSTDPDTALGPAKVWQEGRQTIGSVDFEEADLNPLADKILRKINRGTLKNVSVGFIPTKVERGNPDRGEDPKKVYMDGELMEFSVVHIPSNYQAQLRQADQDWTEFVQNHTPQPEEEIAIPQTLSARRARINFLNINHKTHNDKRTVKGAEGS